MLLSGRFPRLYRSCLLERGNISRLALCLLRIELKLRRFRKPTFMGLNPVRVASISRVFHEYLISSHKPVFIGLNYRCGLHLKLNKSPALQLSVISRQHGNNNRTITGQESAVATILTKPRMLYVCEGDFGI